jgi:hypothetical protein
MATARWSSNTRSISSFYLGFIAKGPLHIEWTSRQIRSSALMDRTSFTPINHLSPLLCHYQGHHSQCPLHFTVNYELSPGCHSTNRASLHTIGTSGMWRTLWDLYLAFLWPSGLAHGSQPLVYRTFHDSCPIGPRRIMILNPLPLLLWTDANPRYDHRIIIILNTPWRSSRISFYVITFHPPNLRETPRNNPTVSSAPLSRCLVWNVGGGIPIPQCAMPSLMPVWLIIKWCLTRPTSAFLQIIELSAFRS